MEIKYKAFRQIDDETLMSVYTTTIYKVGKTKVFRKCPAFASDDIISLRFSIGDPDASIWEVLADDKVELPKFLLSVSKLTPREIRSFWNGKIPGSMWNEFEYGYMKIKPVRKVASLKEGE